mmetsp:Transcript_37333/g.60707  ORF Transcript_37333/g.60707 Transcript_37333/m.60707 type:complete len:124 (-) Transcript_37333:3421-3792(-)
MIEGRRRKAILQRMRIRARASTDAAIFFNFGQATQPTRHARVLSERDAAAIFAALGIDGGIAVKKVEFGANLVDFGSFRDLFKGEIDSFGWDLAQGVHTVVRRRHRRARILGRVTSVCANNRD